MSSLLRIIAVFLLWTLPACSQVGLTTLHLSEKGETPVDLQAENGHWGNVVDTPLPKAPSSVGYEPGIVEKDHFASRSPARDLVTRYGDGTFANADRDPRAPFLCADLMSAKSQGCERPVIPFDRLDNDADSQLEDSELPEIVPPPNHSIRTATILAGISVAGLVTYYLLPERVTGLDKSSALTGAGKNLKRAFTEPPVIDQDAPAINYFAHPYFGMQYYLTQRNYNESVLWSFTFSSLISIGFEYGVEVFGEQPSIQDLVITSVVGSLVGELNYQLTQRMRKGGFTTFEKIVVTILNPLYVLQNGYR